MVQQHCPNNPCMPEKVIDWKGNRNFFKKGNCVNFFPSLIEAPTPCFPTPIYTKRKNKMICLQGANYFLLVYSPFKGDYCTGK